VRRVRHLKDAALGILGRPFNADDKLTSDTKSDPRTMRVCGWHLVPLFIDGAGNTLRGSVRLNYLSEFGSDLCRKADEERP
jgi:hypothetical protein